MSTLKETEARKRLVEEKTCLRCHNIKPLSDFYRNRSKSDGHQNWCKSCQLENQVEYKKDTKILTHCRDYARERAHRMGLNRPMWEARDCGLYLGVCVTENLLASIFKNVKHMSHGNPGFDFICGGGKRIDAKSACRLHQVGRSDSWAFHVKRNRVADYFLCLGFDDRESLNPEHVWLIPGHVVNNKKCFAITESRLEKWSVYEKPINAIALQCEKMKASV